MNKKNIFIIAIAILIALTVFFLYWFLNDSSSKLEDNLIISLEDDSVIINEETSVGLPNPASLYCEQEEGVLEIRTGADGGQQGFCLFSDDSECEEWQFFRSECKKGDNLCKDLCGDGICQEIVCMAVGCPCAETSETCPQDCL